MANGEPRDLLREVRLSELIAAEQFLPHGKSPTRVLEIGAGSGHQAAWLAGMGYQVEAIDLASSPYFHVQAHTVRPFDGRNIPFPDYAFDAVYTSNVLEHVEDLGPLLAEMWRVLKPGGIAVHLMPTSAWRSWSLLTHFGWAAKRLLGLIVHSRKQNHASELGRTRKPTTLGSAAASILPRRHGEHGTAIGEVFTYRRARWIREITSADFVHVRSDPAGVFYTDALLFGDLLPLQTRKKLATYLGSACNIYVFKSHNPILALDTPKG